MKIEQQIIDALTEINKKLDVVSALLQGQEPAGKNNRIEQVLSALYEVMADGEERHIFELTRLINNGDYLNSPISEASLSGHCNKLVGTGQLVKHRKGVFGPVLEEQGEETGEPASQRASEPASQRASEPA